MSFKKIFFILIISGVIVWSFLSSFKTTEKNNVIVDTAEVVEDISSNFKKENSEIPKSLNVESRDTGKRADNSKNLTPEANEERYKKLGFVQDPDNESRLMKVTINKDGRKSIMYVDKNPETFEVNEKTVKNALETLETKRGLNPADEILNLRPMDLSIQDNIMLNGYFRDNEKDLEIFFSPVLDEEGNYLNEDMVCFISPKLKINISKKDKKSVLRADETGYGIAQLSNNMYLRFTWSFEDVRTLHGSIFSVNNGNLIQINTFSAKEVHVSKGEKLKYCN